MAMTALSWAAMRNSNPQVIRVILEAGADAESRDVGGDTPLMFAARYNPSPAVLAALLTTHPNIEARDHTEETALLLAARYNNVAVVTQLLDSGADAKAQDNLNLTALDWAKNNAKLRGSRVMSRLKDSPG
jgi:ankyrin repeat protein